MTIKKLTCPVCGSEEKTFKVSEIYIQSLVRLKHGDEAEAPIIDALQQEIPAERRDKLKGSRYYRQLMESFAPPQGESTASRAINPDWVAVGMFLLSLFFLYQIFATQYGAFWYMVAMVVVAFGAYLFFRTRLLARYQAQRDQESGQRGLVEKSVGQWMKLYYCATDNVVFGLKKDENVPIDQMRPYLLAKSR
jgi:hypothetical protein